MKAFVDGDGIMESIKVKALCITAAAAAFLAFSGCSELTNREDFATGLKHKTESEVLKYAGKPKEVDRASAERVTYIYKSRTFEVATRKTDSETDVIFTPESDGKLHVSEVVFK
jgi:hypothetical protein